MPLFGFDICLKKTRQFFSRVDEYIKSGLEDAIVDSDPDLIYTKRKIAREQARSSHETVASTSIKRQFYLCFSASREDKGQLSVEWMGELTAENAFFLPC